MGSTFPAPGAKTLPEDRAGFIAACESESPAERQRALRNLCTCHVQGDDDEVWRTLFRMLDDPAPKVRAEAMHSVTDSTPRVRVDSVVAALEERRNDPDPKLRRRIRKTLAYFRRTGQLSDAAG